MCPCRNPADRQAAMLTALALAGLLLAAGIVFLGAILVVCWPWTEWDEPIKVGLATEF